MLYQNPSTYKTPNESTKTMQQRRTQNNHEPECEAQRVTITNEGNAVEERAKSKH